MTDRVMLTDAREQVLNDEYDGSDAALRKQKSRLRNSTHTVLDELTEIAQSPHIDNSKAFPPEKVGELIEALFVPTIEPDEYHDYRKDLYFNVRRPLDAKIDD